VYKSCLKCQKQFEIRSRDIEFYKKISPIINGEIYLIPEPTLCPKCRMKRRLIFRNEINFYKRESFLNGEQMISIFADENLKVMTREQWWSDDWEGLTYGRDFDFARPFFEQFHNLWREVPMPPLVNNGSVNSEYCNFADQNKDCYLLSTANENSDCYYGFWLVGCVDVADSSWVNGSELIYEGVNVRKSYNLRYVQNCENCTESAFLLDCRNVHKCFFCINLSNQEYCIFNKKCTPEDYNKFREDLAGDSGKYDECLRKFAAMKSENNIRRDADIYSSENCTGDKIYNSKNVYDSFEIYDSEDVSYVDDGLLGKDCYDICFFHRTELCYESNSLIGYGFRFCNYCRNCQNIYYCDNCHSSSDLFGCVGLRNKKYCILNKQYSKEDYEKLIARIIVHMQETKEWGEFFPSALSPFAYNETLANEFFPMERDQVIKEGLRWKEKDPREYLDSTYQGGFNQSDASVDICKEILSCINCQKNYKIIQREYDFYKKMVLPLPQKCPDCRLKSRFSQKNSYELQVRKCAMCNKDIRTTHKEEEKISVYCHDCYLEN